MESLNSAFGVGDFISWGDGNEMVGRRRGGQFLPRLSRLRIDAEKKKVRQELSSGTPGAECRDVRGLSPATPGAEFSDTRVQIPAIPRPLQAAEFLLENVRFGTKN